MAMTYETEPDLYTSVLKTINTVFTSVFIAEACIKLIAYGPSNYFYKGWNQFDFFVVMTSILDIVMEYSGSSLISFLKVGPQIARVFRVLRVSRLLRLIKQLRDLQKILQVALFSLPQLANVSALLCLVYFIFAVLAVFLFGKLKHGTYLISDTRNFTNFH